MLIGFGVVGSSLAEIFLERKEMLRRRFGLNPNVIAIADSKGAVVDPRGIDLAAALKAKKEAGLSMLKEHWREGAKAPELLEQLECDVMVEAAPTDLKSGQPGLDYIRTAMRNEVHVVTTDKGPLAIAMPALIELAEHNNVMLKFSGTVGGGTPMLDFAKKCLDGMEILKIQGILNGTTNYILTKMDSEGVSLQAALDEAKKLGYAEADPTYDIDGLDAAGKLVILANWVMGKTMSIRDVKIQGIRDITTEQVEKAKAEGKAMKLIATCNEDAEVAPITIERTHPLNVSHTINALTFTTDFSGEITIVGRGAGGPETASAALRDLISIRRSYSRPANSSSVIRRT